MAGMDFSPLISVIEGNLNKDDASTIGVDTLDNLDDAKQMSKGKPPRHIFAMQHITNTTTTRLQVLVNAVNLHDPQFREFFGCFCNEI